MKLVALGERLLVTLWVGGLWSVGYIAVPVLFANLDDRQLAGTLAGELLSSVGVVGVISGLLLITLALTRASGKGVWRSPRVLILTVMVLLVLVEFLVQPMMAVTRAQGLAEGTRAARDFAVLHGISSTLYLVTSLLGLVLVTMGSRDSFRRE